MLKIDSRESVVAFQEELPKDYPWFDQQVSQQLQLDVAGGSPSVRTIATNVWRFSNADRSTIVSLTSDAVTLESATYDGRGLFLRRWSKILSLVEHIFQPGLVLRTGARYLNRIEGGSVDGLTDWILGSLIGVALPTLRGHVTQAISEANIKVEEGGLMLRWGIVAPNTTIDPSLEPLRTPSWILDIDVFSSEEKQFSESTLTAEFLALAARAYAIFRYAVTPAGLEHFGASSRD